MITIFDLGLEIDDCFDCLDYYKEEKIPDYIEEKILHEKIDIRDDLISRIKTLEDKILSISKRQKLIIENSYAPLFDKENLFCLSTETLELCLEQVDNIESIKLRESSRTIPIQYTRAFFDFSPFCNLKYISVSAYKGIKRFCRMEKIPSDTIVKLETLQNSPIEVIYLYCIDDVDFTGVHKLSQTLKEIKIHRNTKPYYKKTSFTRIINEDCFIQNLDSLYRVKLDLFNCSGIERLKNLGLV